MAIRFEKVSRFADADFNLPVRKTKNSAGYDFEVAEDICIPTWTSQLIQLGKVNTTVIEPPVPLDILASWTKSTKAKPTLVSTGVKCHLEEGYYLELSVRSSTPLKYWIVLANSVGIIDADYCDNPDNEGEIFFQVINLSPYPIQLKRGDIIGQGIIKRYEVTDDDIPMGKRIGGFGSTSNQKPKSDKKNIQVNLNIDKKTIEKAVRDEFDKAIKNVTFEPNYNAITMGIQPGKYNDRGLRASCGIIDEAICNQSREAILKEIEKSIGVMGI